MRSVFSLSIPVVFCLNPGTQSNLLVELGFSNTFFFGWKKRLCSEWIAVGQDFGNVCRNAFCFSAAIAACGKAAQWQWAMKLFRRRLTTIFFPRCQEFPKEKDEQKRRLNCLKLEHLIHWKEFFIIISKILIGWNLSWWSETDLLHVPLGGSSSIGAAEKSATLWKNQESTVKKNRFWPWIEILVHWMGSLYNDGPLRSLIELAG